MYILFVVTTQSLLIWSFLSRFLISWWNLLKRGTRRDLCRWVEVLEPGTLSAGRWKLHCHYSWLRYCSIPLCFRVCVVFLISVYIKRSTLPHKVTNVNHNVQLESFKKSSLGEDPVDKIAYLSISWKIPRASQCLWTWQGKSWASLYSEKPCKAVELWDILGHAREDAFLQFQTWVILNKHTLKSRKH